MTESTPFYYSNSGTAISIHDVEFHSTSLPGTPLNIGYSTGEASETLDLSMLPTIHDIIAETANLDSILQSVAPLGIEQLHLLSAVYRNGAQFVLDRPSRHLAVFPKSDEIHFLIEKLIADNEHEQFAEYQTRVAQAAFSVGQMLREGIGTELDIEQSQHYYYEACSKNHGEACYILGVFQRKHGDQRVSHDLFLRGAHLNSASAQYNVAADLINGEVVDQDEYNAYFWASVAKLNGDAGAQHLLDHLETAFNEEEKSSLANTALEFVEQR